MEFQIRTSREIFSESELEILTRYGEAFEDLMEGRRPPETPAQERFLRVCHDEAEPATDYERVWRKYLNRLKWERDPSNRAAMGPPRRAEEGFGGSREDWKCIRNSQWGGLMGRYRDAD
jgi:uncharacterized protein YifE (UPF0438 family)